MLYIYILYSCYVTIKEKSNINKKLIDRHASWSTTGCHWKYIICIPFQGNVCSLTHSNNIWRLVLSKWQVSFITSWDPWNLWKNLAFDSRSSSYHGKPQGVSKMIYIVCDVLVFHTMVFDVYPVYPMQTWSASETHRLQPRRSPEEHDSLLVSAPGTRRKRNPWPRKKGAPKAPDISSKIKSWLTKMSYVFHNRCIKRFRKASVDQFWLGFYQIRHKLGGAVCVLSPPGPSRHSRCASYLPHSDEHNL